MIEINWALVLVLIVCLVLVDKSLTVINIKSVEKNFPDVDRYSIEKNPVAKSFFIKFGLGWGTILYFLLSIITFIIALILLAWCIGLLKIPNAFSISLYIMTIWYGFVIANNLFFLFKFNGIIP